MLSMVRTALISRLMVGYEFDVGQFKSREIRDRSVGKQKLVLEFPCLITQICLKVEVQKFPKIDQFIGPKNSTDLGLNRDATNPMNR